MYTPTQALWQPSKQFCGLAAQMAAQEMKGNSAEMDWFGDRVKVLELAIVIIYHQK